MATRNPRLYVGNIPFNATEADIRQFFDGFKLLQIKFIIDHDTNRPRGFCFVEVESVAEQKSAIEQLDGREMSGRRVVVNEAKDKPKSGGRDRREQRGKSW